MTELRILQFKNNSNNIKFPTMPAGMSNRLFSIVDISAPAPSCGDVGLEKGIESAAGFCWCDWSSAKRTTRGRRVFDLKIIYIVGNFN
jgi:hypothetical protein